MDLGGEDSTGIRQTTRNQSSSSSTFFSANQSPFFSPKSSTFRVSKLPENQCQVTNVDDESDLENNNGGSEFVTSVRFSSTDVYPCAETSTPNVQLTLDDDDPCCSPRVLSSDEAFHTKDHYRNKGSKARRVKRSVESPVPTSFLPCRPRSCDVYIGFHGRKPLLLRFTNWLRAELESQGFNCFAADMAKCRNSRKHSIVEKAIDSCAFGVVILTKKSFRNPYTIEELRFFSSKNNLVPLYFDLVPDDCLARDIIEKRGEIWEKHGGELWLLYGGLEKEWRDAVGSLSRNDEWKLDAHDGKWRDCILRGVMLLALRMGKRSVVDRLNKWKEKAEKNEFPFPRNDKFVGRRKELSELEFMLFGDVNGDGERDYFELKTRPRRKNVTLAWGRTNSIDEKRKGKEPIVWMESEKEIQLHNSELSSLPLPRGGSGGKNMRRRPMKPVYGMGIASVSGESGIGKTELLLEFVYRFHQRYKMVLWIGGESRYIRQNYMNLLPFLETDAATKTNNNVGKARPRSFVEQEEATIARIRKKLNGNIPFLVVIDSLESEKDWWDHKHVMNLLPRFGGESHAIISTRLPQIMNLEPLKLSYLSAAEALSLMQQGGVKDQSNSEFDALRVIEERLGRLTLGLAIVGAILSELPINPSRLLDTINRASSRVVSRENHVLRKNTFLLQLFEVCFSIFDHADGPRSLATRMILASGWFGPGPIPLPVLTLTALKVQEKSRHRRRLWRRILSSFSCGFGSSSYARRSEAEASSLLLRFNIGRACIREGFIHFNHLIKIYARKRGTQRVAQAMVQALICRGSILQNPDHIWAACFLLLGFGKDPIVVELKVQELLHLIKEVILPLAIRTFITFSRCNVAMELLRLAIEALEATDQELVTPVDKWFSKSRCCGSLPTNAQLNPSLWQELALARASVLEVRAKLMLRGGQLDIGENLIRKAVFIRTSICGELHQDTVSARETLSKFTRLLSTTT